MPKFRVQVRRVDYFEVEVDAADAFDAAGIAEDGIYGAIPLPVPLRTDYECDYQDDVEEITE
jgi:hypothetical protein